jgi:hypothetical protein
LEFSNTIIVNLGKNCAFLIVFSVVTYFMICQKRASNYECHLFCEIVKL